MLNQARKFSVAPMMDCIYCDLELPEADFSDEHIWPDALGGDYLPSFWRTDVCAKCNSMSGVFVDGAFIKSWMGMRERAAGAREYLSPQSPRAMPLNYVGILRNVPQAAGRVTEMWLGPCNETILHIRPENAEEIWDGYLGGDPRAKKKNAGRVYLIFSTQEMFWIRVVLNSVMKHFKRSARFLVNGEMQAQAGGAAPFSTLDRTDPDIADDLPVVDALLAAGEDSTWIHAKPPILATAANRFLPKLALAIGAKVCGQDFLKTSDAVVLRAAFRQRDDAKRDALPVRGVGYFNEDSRRTLGQILSWTGAWVLMLRVVEGELVLVVATPSGRAMQITVTDDPACIRRAIPEYEDGMVWLTIPSLEKAAGPIPLPEYLAHRLRHQVRADLLELEEARIDPRTLPSCGPKLSLLKRVARSARRLWRRIADPPWRSGHVSP